MNTRTLLVSCGKAQFHCVRVEVGADDPRAILLAAQVTFDHYAHAPLLAKQGKAVR